MQGRYSQAVNVLDGAAQVCTGSSQIKLLRGEALIGAERYDEAFAVLTQLMRTDSSSPELLFLRARCLYFQGEFPSAIKHLQQALRSDPDNSKCMKEIKRIRHLESSKEDANNAFKAGKMAEAVEMYTSCLTIDPQNKAFNSKIHCNRANALSRLNRHEEAIKDCDKAIYYDHGYAKAYLRKAACLKALGGLENLEQALRVYDQASSSWVTTPSATSRTASARPSWTSRRPSARTTTRSSTCRRAPPRPRSRRRTSGWRSSSTRTVTPASRRSRRPRPRRPSRTLARPTLCYQTRRSGSATTRAWISRTSTTTLAEVAWAAAWAASTPRRSSRYA